MTMAPYRIVFMGTPEFSVPTLKALGRSDHVLAAVVTNPDRPKGRGRRFTASPVKVAATAEDLQVLQPVSVRDPRFIPTLVELEPDLLVVIAFGQILSAEVLSIPRIGAINVHASILPQYRGAAPIQWAIINGENETGVTTMWMDEGMDSGDMLLTARVPITSKDTAGTLHDVLSHLGANLLIETLNALALGTLIPTPQDHSVATYAPLLKKNDGVMDWTKDADRLDCFVRGMHPWPGAFTFYKRKRLKIVKARAVKKTTDLAPGTVLESFPGDLDVATGDGILRLEEVHLESGKCLPVSEFLMGCGVPPGAVLG